MQPDQLSAEASFLTSSQYAGVYGSGVMSRFFSAAEAASRTRKVSDGWTLSIVTMIYDCDEAETVLYAAPSNLGRRLREEVSPENKSGRRGDLRVRGRFVLYSTNSAGSQPLCVA
jgi:hypothetical protein